MIYLVALRYAAGVDSNNSYTILGYGDKDQATAIYLDIKNKMDAADITYKEQEYGDRASVLARFAKQQVAAKPIEEEILSKYGIDVSLAYSSYECVLLTVPALPKEAV